MVSLVQGEKRMKAPDVNLYGARTIGKHLCAPVALALLSTASNPAVAKHVTLLLHLSRDLSLGPALACLDVILVANTARSA